MGNTCLHFGAVCCPWSVPYCAFVILIVQLLAQASFTPTQLKALESGADGQVVKTIKTPYHPHADWEIICIWTDTTNFCRDLSLPVSETTLFFCAWIKIQISSSLMTSGGQNTQMLYLSDNRHLWWHVTWVKVQKYLLLITSTV